MPDVLGGLDQQLIRCREVLNTFRPENKNGGRAGQSGEGKCASIYKVKKGPLRPQGCASFAKPRAADAMRPRKKTSKGNGVRPIALAGEGILPTVFPVVYFF